MSRRADQRESGEGEGQGQYGEPEGAELPDVLREAFIRRAKIQIDSSLLQISNLKRLPQVNGDNQFFGRLGSLEKLFKKIHNELSLEGEAIGEVEGIQGAGAGPIRLQEGLRSIGHSIGELQEILIEYIRETKVDPQVYQDMSVFQTKLCKFVQELRDRIFELRVNSPN